MSIQTDRPTAPTITKDAARATSIACLLVRPQDQARLVDDLIARADKARPGLISASIHHSLDGERVLVYGQWEGAADAKMTGDLIATPSRGLALAVDQHLYDVVYTNDVTPAGATGISAGNEYATFINIMHTTPDQQGALVDFVIANDDRIFTPHPGFRSANFHRSRDGERVVNYSHWASEGDFLDAINAMMRAPGLTMSRANELASQAAGARGWTDFRFYAVDAAFGN